MDLSSLSVEQLKRALELKEQITRMEAELSNLVSSEPRAAARIVNRPKSTITPAGRARIVAAQRRRWARERALKAAPQPSTSTPGRRVLSNEARAKMAAASRERWARVKEHQEEEK